jgi:hypothetical protein
MMSQEKTAIPLKPVAYRGRMVKREGERAARYQPENHAFLGELCDRGEDGRPVGKDPMALPLELLTASGHPQTHSASVVFRMRIMHGVDTGEERGHGFLGLQPDDFPKRLTAIRETFCMPCSSNNMAEIRRCPIIDCPSWAFRMGRNPHNPSRGVDRFGDKRFLKHRSNENV